MEYPAAELNFIRQGLFKPYTIEKAKKLWYNISELRQALSCPLIPTERK